MMTFRSTIARGTLLAAGSLFAAAALLACGDDDDAPATPAPGADAQPDTTVVPEADASDAGADVTDASVPENRPPFDAAPPEVTCAVTPCMKRIVAGPKNYCATATDGVVRCWGEPSPLGAFVASGPNAGATPVVLDGLGDIVDVGIGSYDTCVANATGSVVCFGSQSREPAPVPSIANAKKLAIGDDRKCAVLASGELSCWGDSYTTGQGEATIDLGGQHAVAAEMQWASAFALGSQGTLFSWGSERYSLGRTTAISPDLTPAPVAGLPPVLQMSASDGHVCAISVDGRLFCWGRADSGALGLGYVRHEYHPVEVAFPGPAYPAKVVAADTHSCARMTDGSLTCWANLNWYGELGYPSATGVYVPTKVTLAQDVVDLAIGYGSTCAVLVDGSVQCWGDNSAGQLGQSIRDSVRHPFPATVAFP